MGMFCRQSFARSKGCTDGLRSFFLHTSGCFLLAARNGVKLLKLGGRRGIRTPDVFCCCFAGSRVRPLRHTSMNSVTFFWYVECGTIIGFDSARYGLRKIAQRETAIHYPIFLGLSSTFGIVDIHAFLVP
jgi:hypothetical protein